MKRKSLFLFLAFFLTAALTAYTIGGNTMPEINFDLGRNIILVAEKSGLPQYSARNINGLISYSNNNIPGDISVRFTRKGYEISAKPVFSLTMYTDEKRDPSRNVQDVSIMIETRKILSHKNGRAAVDGITSQFKNGRWRRHLSYECPAIQGRSTILDENSKITYEIGCALDPEYTLTDNEWINLMARDQKYQWIGDGILATLSANYDESDGKLDYTMFLDFEDLAIKKTIEKENLERDLTEGDAKGWKRSEDHAAAVKRRKIRNRILEENAVARGDQLVPR